MKKIGLALLLFAIVASCGFENRKGYYYDNQRYNYVRLEKFKDADGGEINHPYTFTDPQISTILKTLAIKKGSAFSKDEKEKDIFDSYAIGKLTPAIVEAFKNATPEQRVGFAFMIKDPMIIIKNDRLSTGWMWVENGKLNIEFDLIYVKLTGDTDKRGYDAMNQQTAKARGLRVTLDLQAGQSYGDDTQSLMVDLGVIDQVTEERLKKEKELAERGVEADVKIRTIKEKDSRSRMKELDTLRKERMITEEEYQAKKKEILNEL